MAALRALLFAVFGGFIGAAPAAPVAVADASGAFTDAGKQTQKDERPGGEIRSRDARGIAAAPPRGGVPPVATEPSPSASAARPPVAIPAPLRPDRDRGAEPPPEDVRAGLLALPPPAR
jgi:hypothetical protein